MPIEIFGSLRSRTRRVLWAAIELGIDFEHIPYAWNDPILKGESFLQMNPLGRVPAYKDGGFTLSESLAINLHIAKKYSCNRNPAIYPEGIENEARLWQWSFFAASDLDPWVVTFGDNTAWQPEEKRIPALADYSRMALNRSLRHLEATLASMDFLTGSQFTIADLNVASVLQSLVPLAYPFDPFPNVETWLGTNLARPAARAAMDYP